MRQIKLRAARNWEYVCGSDKKLGYLIASWIMMLGFIVLNRENFSTPPPSVWPGIRRGHQCDLEEACYLVKEIGIVDQFIRKDPRKHKDGQCSDDIPDRFRNPFALPGTTQ